MRKCSIQNLDAVFSKIAEEAKLYIPQDSEKGTDYKEWTEGAVLSNSLNTKRSPKDFFFPQTEDLMKFKTEGMNIEITDVRTESEDFVVFGLRACDVRSFDILDRVFLTDPVDSFYASRPRCLLSFLPLLLSLRPLPG